jgi:hypothetical protein
MFVGDTNKIVEIDRIFFVQFFEIFFSYTIAQLIRFITEKLEIDTCLDRFLYIMKLLELRSRSCLLHERTHRSLFVEDCVLVDLEELFLLDEFVVGDSEKFGCEIVDMIASFLNIRGPRF